MRRSRDELTKDVEEMVRLRNEENKTYRQIAEIMGYKSPGTISDLLRRRGHFSIVLNKNEIDYLVNGLSKLNEKMAHTIAFKLTKTIEGK